jgi:hypothetical protein
VSTCCENACGAPRGATSGAVQEADLGTALLKRVAGTHFRFLDHDHGPQPLSRFAFLPFSRRRRPSFFTYK